MVWRGGGECAKKPVRPSEEEGGHKSGLRGIYLSFFKAWGRVPDEIGRQTPENIFFLLSHLGESGDVGSSDAAEATKIFYGL